MNKCRYCNKTVKWNERYFEDYCSVQCATDFVEKPIVIENTFETQVKELTDMILQLEIFK